MNLIDVTGLDSSPFNFSPNTIRPLVQHHLYDVPHHYRLGLPLEKLQDQRGLLAFYTAPEFNGFQERLRIVI